MKRMTLCVRLYAVAIGIVACPFAGFATTDLVADGIEYVLSEDGTAQMAGVSDPAVTEIIVPAAVTHSQVEYPVSSVADGAFDSCKSLRKVTIADSESVLSLGSGFNSSGYRNGLFFACPLEEVYIGRPLDYSYAPLSDVKTLRTATVGEAVTILPEEIFSECSALEQVSLPETLTEIPRLAFRKCASLKSISIPASVRKIGDAAFAGCLKLERVETGDLAAWCGIRFAYGESNPLVAAGHLFVGGQEVTDLVIPSSVTEICDYAFSGCHGLTSLTTGDNLTKIGKGAFLSCYGLERADFGKSIDIVEYNAFKGCSGLERVVFQSSLKMIGSDAFRQCDGIRRVDIVDLAGWCGLSFSGESNPLCYGGHLFVNGEKVVDLSIPEGVAELGDYAFNGCGGLVTVEMPASLAKIGHRVFRDCPDLKRAKIGSGVEKIGGSVFYGCKALEELAVENPVPPVLDKLSFTQEQYATLPVFVPVGTESAYRSAAYWMQFEKLAERDFSSVGQLDLGATSVVSEGDAIRIFGVGESSVKRVYNVNGQLVYAGNGSEIPLSSGFYIVVVGSERFKVAL